MRFSADTDYATVVSLNTEKYPALDDQGLFLVTGYDEGNYGRVHEVHASDRDNVARYFDPSKPSIILVHGIQLGNGRYGKTFIRTENREDEVRSKIYNAYVDGEIDYLAGDEAFDREHDLSKYWYDGAEGQPAYNVFYFHYERFADCIEIDGENLIGMVGGPDQVQNRIWSRTNGVQAMYFDAAQQKFVYTQKDEALGGYSLAELYTAEFLRAFGYVDELYPQYKASDPQIISAAHSMGGVLNVAGNILLKQVAEAGQIDMRLTVNRLIQMDSYIGPNGDVGDERIAWNGEKFASLDNEGTVIPSANGSYICGVEALAFRYDTAIDFYVNEGFAVPFMTSFFIAWDNDEKLWVGQFEETANRLNTACTMVLLEPYFAGVEGVMINGHNPIREWILSSYLYDAPLAQFGDITCTVPTARMSNEDVIGLRGSYFVMLTRDKTGAHIAYGDTDSYSAEGVETVRCDDDEFVRLK